MSEKDAVILLHDQDQKLEVEAVELPDLIAEIVASMSRGVVFMNMHLLLAVGCQKNQRISTVMEYGMAYLLPEYEIAWRDLCSQLISINFNVMQLTSTMMRTYNCAYVHNMTRTVETSSDR